LRHVVFALLAGLPLIAQGTPRFDIPGEDRGVQYHFQLRASKAGSALRDQVGNQIAGGGGFMALFGEEPLRVRVRMDGDNFPSQDGRQRVQTEGLGVEAFLFFTDGDAITPYLSVGPAFQRWEIGGGDYPGQAPRSLNKLAGRAETGVWFKERVGASIGVLFGSIDTGRKAASPYLAITFRF